MEKFATKINEKMKLSHSSLTEWIFMQQFHKFLPNFACMSQDCHAKVMRQPYDTCQTLRFVRDINTSIPYFSRQIVASCSHVFSRLSHNCGTTFV